MFQAMTLEVTLWAIPAASLLAASVLIVVRAWRLTRESAVADALLARALSLALPAAPPERPAAIPVVAITDRKKSQHPRLCPVPIVVCRRRDADVAMAG